MSDLPGHSNPAGKATGNLADIAQAAADIFALNSWTWTSPEGRYVPDASELATNIRLLCDALPGGARSNVSAGRLRVERATDGSVAVSIDFALGWL